MEFTVYGKEKNFKVAFFARHTFGDTLTEDGNIFAISDFNDVEIHLFSTNNKAFASFGSHKEHIGLNEKKVVRETYSFILDYIRGQGISVCIFFGSGYPWHEDFLDRLKGISYVACYFGDDPEGAKKTSEFYVKNFHYAFCGGVFFDGGNTIEEKYLEWGARKAKFIPLGANPVKYREPVKDLDKRSIDFVYVGGCYFPKILRMFRLKRHFGNRMRMYGRGWNNSNSKMKTLILRLLKFIFQIPYIEELPKNELVELYQNTKIGFNMHMSYGPSNLRLYELPMNGVMQICDCRDGLSRLYEIGKEVVSYETIGEAVKKIEYYLENENERREIAYAGYKRASNNYKLEYIFKSIFDSILVDIKNNFPYDLHRKIND